MAAHLEATDTAWWHGMRLSNPHVAATPRTCNPAPSRAFSLRRAGACGARVPGTCPREASGRLEREFRARNEGPGGAQTERFGR